MGGPGFTFIHDKRDNPLESTKGTYFTLDAFASSTSFGSEADFGRALGQYSTYYAFGGKGRAGHQYVFARSTSIGLEQPYGGTRVVPPGACPLNLNTGETICQGITLIPSAGTILRWRRQLSSRIRVKSGRTARPVVRFPCRRHGAVRQQPGTALSRDFFALPGTRIRFCHLSRYGKCFYRAARHAERECCAGIRPIRLCVCRPVVHRTFSAIPSSITPGMITLRMRSEWGCVIRHPLGRYVSTSDTI